VAIEQWEKENNREFRIGGMQFFDYCRLQWEEYKMTKELQRQQRVSEEHQMQYRKAPVVCTDRLLQPLTSMGYFNNK